METREETGEKAGEETAEASTSTTSMPQPLQARRELTCILFPGIVRDHERAIQCLGGIKEISKVYSEPTSRRLGLSFNPENPFAKKAFGDLVAAPGLLLRVKVRRRKGEKGSHEVVSTTIVGEVNRTLKFESMFDFSILPTPLESRSSPPQCLMHQLLPTGVDDLTWMCDYQMNIPLHSAPAELFFYSACGPAPHFIVPAHFTRSDKPLDYRYSDKTSSAARKIENPSDDVHNKLRPDRINNGTHIMFSLTDALPAEPNPRALVVLNKRIEATPRVAQDLNAVKKALEERPIWSKSALQFHTKLSSMSLKLILPTLCYYYRNGPWRQLWVRFGYDPRKDPQARMYQTLDFRMRNVVGVTRFISQRNPYKHKKVARVRQPERRNPFLEPTASDEILESAVIFREGMIPSQKQIYYQYCDIHAEEVERLLQVQEVAPGTLCHARRGWLPAGLDDRIRETITNCTRRTVLLKSRETSDTHQKPEDLNSSGEDGEGVEGDLQLEWGASEEYILPDMQE